MTELRFDHRIILVVLSKDSAAQQICLELLSKGAKLIVLSTIPVDFPCMCVSSLSELSTCISKLGKIDAFINCHTDYLDLSLEVTNWSQISEKLSSIYSITHPVWKQMRKQKTGRILNVLSINSFYSQENATINSLATLAIQGLSNTLVREGSKWHIKVNTLLTSPFDSYSIEKVAPIVSFLVHESCTENGAIIEASAGFVSKLRRERGQGWFFSKDSTAEDVKEKIKEISGFGKLPDYPHSYQESLLKPMLLNYIQKPKI